MTGQGGQVGGDDGTNSGGRQGAGPTGMTTGIGGEGGTPSGGGGQGADPGAGGMGGEGAPSSLSSRQMAWLGLWRGSVDYQVEGPPDPLSDDPFTPTVVNKNLDVQLRVDHYEEDPTSGWASIDGRISIGYCLLSAPFGGQIFTGDELSRVPEPRVSLSAAGESDLGQIVQARLIGQREGWHTDGVLGGTLAGTISFGSYDKRAPCTADNLLFRVGLAPGGAP